MVWGLTDTIASDDGRTKEAAQQTRHALTRMRIAALSGNLRLISYELSCPLGWLQRLSTPFRGYCPDVRRATFEAPDESVFITDYAHKLQARLRCVPDKRQHRAIAHGHIEAVRTGAIQVDTPLQPAGVPQPCAGALSRAQARSHKVQDGIAA